MKNILDKERERKGLSLSELLVVLSVTLVLTAILLPAIASTDPERAETILSAAATPVVFEGFTKPAPDRERIDRVTRSEIRRNRAAQSEDQVMAAEPAAKAGIKEFATTDIRYRTP